MTTVTRWPPVDPVLIEYLTEYMNGNLPADIKEGMTADDCYQLMTKRAGAFLLIDKLTAVMKSQRSEYGSDNPKPPRGDHKSPKRPSHSEAGIDSWPGKVPVKD